MCDSITIAITGRRYKNLKKVADVLNGVSWCDNDNTAEGLFDAFVFPFLDDYLDSPKQLAENILGCIATGKDGVSVPEPLHSERLKELRAAFSVFGVSNDWDWEVCNG